MLKLEDKRRLTALVEEKLSNNPEVRPFPAAVSRLLAAAQDPNSNAYTFEKIIQCDAALSVKLLRLANSPLYGLDREIRGIGHAATILGLRQLKSLALSVAGGSMFAEGATASKERQTLWQHSLACATVARLLAESVSGIAADAAFLAGIFHDVGKLFLYDVAPEEYVELVCGHTGEELIEEEKFVFGQGHEEIGIKSAHSWGLPENIKAAIGYHHDPDKSPMDVEFVTLLHFANRLSKTWGIGAKAEPDAAVEAQISYELGIDDEMLQSLEASVRETFGEVANAW